MILKLCSQYVWNNGKFGCSKDFGACQVSEQGLKQRDISKIGNNASYRILEGF
jgi:hypothetical protein